MANQSVRAPATAVLERGDSYFAYRPRIAKGSG